MTPTTTTMNVNLNAVQAAIAAKAAEIAAAQTAVYGPKEFLATMGMTAAEYLDTCESEDGGNTMALCVHECVITDAVGAKCEHGWASAKSIILQDLLEQDENDEATQKLRMQRALAAEIERLKAENAAIVAGKTAPKTADPAKTPAPSLPAPADYSTADRKLLEVIAKFRSPARADGKVAGTFAVKVHSYFHACGIDELKTREIVQAAEKRGVISKMSIPTKTGNRMMLYFDARERKAAEFGTKVSSEEKSSMAAAFLGL